MGEMGGARRRKPCPRVDDSECDDQHTFALSYADPRSAAAFERAALAPSSSEAAPVVDALARFSRLADFATAIEPRAKHDCCRLPMTKGHGQHWVAAFQLRAERDPGSQ